MIHAGPLVDSLHAALQEADIPEADKYNISYALLEGLQHQGWNADSDAPILLPDSPGIYKAMKATSAWLACPSVKGQAECIEFAGHLTSHNNGFGRDAGYETDAALITWGLTREEEAVATKLNQPLS